MTVLRSFILFAAALTLTCSMQLGVAVTAGSKWLWLVSPVVLYTTTMIPAQFISKELSRRLNWRESGDLVSLSVIFAMLILDLSATKILISSMFVFTSLVIATASTVIIYGALEWFVDTLEGTQSNRSWLPRH